MTTVRSGFMGYAEIDDTKVRCSDFSVQLKQDILFYDHVIGLRDNIPEGLLDGKDDAEANNEQKIFWRPATKIVEGSISFPMTENSEKAFFKQAWKGDWFDVSLFYSCDVGKTFKECRVNRYTFSATAGEPPTVSVNVIGKDVESATPHKYDLAEKIVTWDKVKVSGPGREIFSIEFTINNNCIPIYTAGTNVSTPLVANDIRVGMQMVNGSVAFYDNQGPTDSFVEENEPQTISISIEGFKATLNVIYQYPERNASTTAYIKTVPFVGVGRAIQGT